MLVTLATAVQFSEIAFFINSLASGWFCRFSQKKTTVFSCLANALDPPPIALKSCSTAQTDRPVE